MLVSEGGTEREVRHRISVARFKFRELISVLSNKAIQLEHRAMGSNACIMFTMTYSAATWALIQREENLMHS